MTSAIPPFGHAGERALDKCLAAHGGFDHNAQALRVVTSLEHRYPEFDGLNLTWESLEGIVKHNGPLTERSGAADRAHTANSGIPVGIADFNRKYDLELWSYASLEAQVAAFADDIAYDAHDIDDGLRAGLFGVDDLKVMPLTAAIIAEIDRHYPGLDDARRGAELVRELISYMIGAVMSEAGRRLAAAKPQSAQDVRHHHQPLVAFPPEVAEEEAAIKAFLKQHMYRHPRVMRVMGEAEADPVRPVRALPGLARATCRPEWVEGTERESEGERARRIGNFIAGMTDRFALIEHQRLFELDPGFALGGGHVRQAQLHNICSPTCWRACTRSAPRSRPRANGPPASISRASWSSRRAMPAMATWRPTPRWCWPRKPRPSRAISPRRSRRSCAPTI